MGEQQQLASLLGVSTQLGINETKPSVSTRLSDVHNATMRKMEEPYRSFRIGVTVKEDQKEKIEKIPLNIGKGMDPTLDNKERENIMDHKTKVLLPNVKPEPNSKHEKEKVLDVKSFVFERTASDEKLSISTNRYPTIQEKVTILKSSKPKINVKNSEPKNENVKQSSEVALCEVCSKTFKNKYALKAHMKNHGEKTHICEVCSKSFVNKYILKEHSLTHTQQKSQCQICSASVFALKNHMKMKHGQLATCSNCGVEVKGIRRHEKFCKMTEEERAAFKETIKVECDQCGKILANKFKLLRHTQTTHSKVRPLKCKYCDHRDNRTDNMQTHVKNNHKDMKE